MKLAYFYKYIKTTPTLRMIYKENFLNIDKRPQDSDRAKKKKKKKIQKKKKKKKKKKKNFTKRGSKKQRRKKGKRGNEKVSGVGPAPLRGSWERRKTPAFWKVPTRRNSKSHTNQTDKNSIQRKNVKNNKRKATNNITREHP